jgi:hypothetical protein
MIRLSRLILIAVTVAGIASVAARQSELNAFAMVPGGEGGTFSPAANGGGSVGYNEYLRRDQW